MNHHFSLSFHFPFGKWEPPKGEKARLNGSRACLRSDLRFLFVPSRGRSNPLLPVRPHKPDNSRQENNLHAEMEAVKNLLEARIRIP